MVGNGRLSIRRIGTRRQLTDVECTRVVPHEARKHHDEVGENGENHESDLDNSGCPVVDSRKEHEVGCYDGDRAGV